MSCQVRYAIELPRTVGADDTATVGGGSNCGTSSCAGSSSNADGENADASVIITPETARKFGLRSWRSFWSDIGFESFVTSIAGEPYVRLGASAAYPPQWLPHPPQAAWSAQNRPAHACSAGRGQARARAGTPAFAPLALSSKSRGRVIAGGFIQIPALTY